MNAVYLFPNPDLAGFLLGNFHLKFDDLDLREVSRIKDRLPVPERIHPEHGATECAADGRRDGQGFRRDAEAMVLAIPAGVVV